MILQKRNLLSWKSDIQKTFCLPPDTNLNITLPYELEVSVQPSDYLRCASNHNFCDSTGSELDFQPSKFFLGSNPDFFSSSGFFFNSISKDILLTTAICSHFDHSCQYF